MAKNNAKNATQQNPQNAELNCATIGNSNLEREASVDASRRLLHTNESCGFSDARKQGQKRDATKPPKRETELRNDVSFKSRL